MHGYAHAAASPEHGRSLNRIAAIATLHCLTGCAIGEVLGLVIGTALGWSNAATIALAIALAFVFGYSLTAVPLLRAGLALGVVVPLAFAADTFSIAVMEIVDNGVLLVVPGAMDAPLTNGLFWGALAFALAVAYVVAFPVNRALIARGLGHAVVHAYHGSGAAGDAHAGHGAAAHAHGGYGSARGGAAASPPAGGARRRMIAVGLAAMAVTIGVATGGALLVGHDDAAPAEGHGTAAGEAEEHGGDAELGGLAVAAGEYRVSVPRTRFRVGEATRFGFTVVGPDGPVRRFDEHGGVQMHLIVVRRDLTGYQHVHPTLAPDGSWQIDLTLPRAGVYRAYADFERGGEKTVLGADLFAAGELAPRELPAPATVAEVDGYRVELDGRVEPGAEATLRYRITRGGEPIDVEPYLGAGGHLVALREGDLAYLHVHPVREKRGEISFAATFPTPARYRLFLQFKDDGRVRTVALTSRVDPA